MFGSVDTLLLRRGKCQKYMKGKCKTKVLTSVSYPVPLLRKMLETGPELVTQTETRNKGAGLSGQ